MSPIKLEQKLISYKLHGTSAAAIEKELNDYGSEGWKISMVTPTVSRGNGCSEYRTHIYLLVLNKTVGRYSYKSVYFSNEYSRHPNYIEEMNREISGQNKDGFELVCLMPCSYMDPKIEARGTRFCIAIFMKEINEE